MTISLSGLPLSDIVWNHTVHAPPQRDRANAAPNVISDVMDYTWHPATGEHIDSKSRFRQVTRERGCYEVGNDAQPMPEPVRNTGAGMDIKRAIERLKAR